jgi:hypothetical protein
MSHDRLAGVDLSLEFDTKIAVVLDEELAVRQKANVTGRRLT